MNLLSRILFPAAVLAYAVGGVSGALRPDPGYSGVAVLSPVSDTVVYQSDGYRARRTGDFEPYTIPDSILSSLGVFSIEVKQELTALDTLVPPDSLKYSRPTRGGDMFPFPDTHTVPPAEQSVSIPESMKSFSPSFSAAAEGPALSAPPFSILCL